jgi:CubicO group peptidase (beta-lactamase class C family)
VSRGVIAVVAVLLGPVAALAQRGVQWTPDRLSRLISKDVGSERWAISVDVEDGTVVGNVFRADGGPPQFVWCWPQSTADDPVRLRCDGTTGCDDWTDLGEIELSASFLAPDSSCDATASTASAARAAGVAPDGGSALRVSPDERRVLISKDVGGFRWAIVYERERFGTPSQRRPARLTGNVFDLAGGDPQFVACEIEDVVGGDLALRCSGARACGCAPCAASEWTRLDPVTLPPSFVEERRCPASDAPRGGLEAELAPASPEEAAAFGNALAVAGTTAAVAVPSALYVFERTAGGWVQAARVPSPGGTRFGRGVAAAGGTIAVGDDHRARLYERVDGAWALTTTLDPARIETGRVAAMTDELLLLSSEEDDGRAVLLTFARAGAGWQETERLFIPEDVGRGFFLGIALSGDTLAATVFPGDDGSDPTTFVQIYERSGDAWVASARVPNPARGSDFGRVLALAGDTLAVGLPPSGSWEDREDDGAVHVFQRTGTAWDQVDVLRTCAQDVGRFGSAVEISGDVIAVGVGESASAEAAGDVYLFERREEGWEETKRISYADAAAAGTGADRRELAVDGATLLAGTDEGVSVFDVASPSVPAAVPCPPAAPQLWPTDGWRVDLPAAHGMNPVLLERAREYAFQPGKNTQGVVVVRHGAIVAEWYEDGRDADSYAASWSTAKSVAGAVIGIAIDRGAVPGVDASMATFYPEWSGTEKEAVTLRHVLSMTSGLDWNESYVTDPSNVSDIAALAATERDQLGYVVAKSLGFAPGTYHSYSSGDSMLLSGVIESAVGTSFGAYAREVLFDPIGMTSAEWWSDAVGHTLSYCCLDAPTREFARFGLLWARGGRWDDRQVISESYVRESLTPTVTVGPDGVGTHEYGFQWWLSPGGGGRYTGDGFQARGYDGQYIYVFPSLDLVVVRNGHYDKDPGPPIADPNLFARYPAAGLAPGRGTVPPDQWIESAFLDPIVGSIID